ncbi:MAG: monovalent cation/H(+) antiporter subunit G [Dehalococcoidia bacterium]
MTELIASLVALAGALFLGLAALALHRMPDVYGRLSATSKAVTLGATLLLAAAAIHTREPGVTARVIAGMAFLLLTSPIAGHVLGRAAWRAGEPPTVVHSEDFPTGPGAEDGPFGPEESSGRTVRRR